MARVRPVSIGPVTIGGGHPLVLIAGPCVIESEAHAVELGGAIAAVARRNGVPYIFKASFDKANRTSVHSFRGPGLEAGMHVLAEVKARLGVPVLTDIHEAGQAAPVAEVADVLQIPAFLCRQTDLLLAAAATGRAVNVKKGQFLAPQDMRHAAEKVASAGNERILLTERGAAFGYQVVFDVTHSLQLPGAGDGVTAGQAEFIETLAPAGVAAGVDGVFLEIHEEPSRARSDAQNALALDRLDGLLRLLTRIDAVCRGAS
jgi:2-dehydro-3-deoxyphosphooctonate aldolase (KDO 8-P synthase)